ncbi:HmuY family protein [Chryseobacterium indoltheticum]|uniref:HmuY family protein n=1 Tax=Chryseobacterium indoltheticum TaxID=254 RepID=UPI003F496260
MDLCFTVFTNYDYRSRQLHLRRFVTTNNVGGVGAYEVVIPSPASGVEAYTNFKVSDIDPTKFIYNNQRVIGANWRNPVGTNGLEVYGDRFYVVKDPDGNYFKLRFTRLTKATTDQSGQAGERGFAQFEYKPLY